MKKLVTLASIALFLTGCGSTMTPTKTIEQSYMIIDVKGNSSIRDSLLDSLIETTQDNMDSLAVNRSIPSANLPEKASRFELVNPIEGAMGGMGALLAASGANLKVPKCNEPLLTVRSTSSTGDWGDSTTFFFCVVQYQQGYQIDVYTTFEQTTGGLSVQALSKSIASSLVGDPSQIIPRTMKRLYETAKSVDGSAEIVDSYIPQRWKGAFLDETDMAKASE